MKAPCGHAEAVCVIGNYWDCKRCSAPEFKPAALASIKDAAEVKQQMLNSLFEKQRVFVEKKVEWQRDYVGTWKPINVAHQPEKVPHRPWHEDLTAAMVEGLKPIQQALIDEFGCADKAYGSETHYYRGDGTRGVARRNRLYATSVYTWDSTKHNLHHAIGNAVHQAKELAAKIREHSQAIADHHGWDKNYHLWSLGKLPHVVIDDGSPVRLVGGGDAGSNGGAVVVRAFWVVLPGPHGA